MSSSHEQPWYVYLIECRDGSIYTGVAVDVPRRYATHLSGKGAKYTRSRPPKQLLAAIAFPGRSQALKAEYAIKKLSAADKRDLCIGHEIQAASDHPVSPKNETIKITASLPANGTPSTIAHPIGTQPMLKTGDIAPSFSLVSNNGKTISSASVKGQRYVLYFYPKDDTPGCTREACAFRDQQADFEKLGVPVFGLSADSEKSHARFAAKYGLNFPLLSDPEHLLLESYGVWVEKNMYGRKYFGIQRSTFVIAGNGSIEQVWEKVSPEGHVVEVMAWLADKSAPGTVKKLVAKKVPAEKTLVGGVPAKSGKSAAAKKVAGEPAPARTKVASVAKSGGKTARKVTRSARN